MANQNDTPSIDDLDLSGVDGYEPNNVEVTIEDGEPIEDTQSEPTQSEPIVDSEEPEAEPEDSLPIRWQDVEGMLPEPLHEEFRPLVDEWRRQYSRVLDETEPFRRFIENGVSYRDMDLAIQIQKALVEDPKRFYDGLGETYGWAQQAVAPPVAPAVANTQQSDDIWDLGETETTSERESQLMQMLQQQQSRLDQLEQVTTEAQQMQYEEQMRLQGRQMLEQELSTIEQKYGDFDKEEVVRRAMANAAAGGDASVTKAFHELKDYENKIRQQYAASRPPKVMGSGSGMTPAPPPDLSSEDARREAALQLAIRLGAQEGGVN